MRDLYDEVGELNDLLPKTPTERLGKLTEEVGELATEINKTNGMKVHSNTKEEIIEEITKEGADVIQNAFSILKSFGIEYDDVVAAMEKKNDKWRSNINDTNEN